jgi:hypothetical protein
MSYEIDAIEPSGNGIDLVLKLRRRPSWWQRLWGEREQPVAFFGPRPHWITMDGREAPPHVQRAVDAVWHRYDAVRQPRIAEAWNLLDPKGDEEHRQMAHRAAGLPPDTNRQIAQATGEPLGP